MFNFVRTALTAAILQCYMAESDGVSSDASDETLLGLDDLNDVNLNDVEDVPEFVEPPNGIYQLGLTAKIEQYKDKEQNQKTRIRHIYNIEKVYEIADKNELVPPDGSLFSETFLGNSDGLKYWKLKAKSILGELGDTKVSEVITELNNGVSFKASTKLKETTDKFDKTKKYTNVQVRVLSPE